IPVPVLQPNWTRSVARSRDTLLGFRHRSRRLLVQEAADEFAIDLEQARALRAAARKDVRAPWREAAAGRWVEQIRRRARDPEQLLLRPMDRRERLQQPVRIGMQRLAEKLR